MKEQELYSLLEKYKYNHRPLEKTLRESLKLFGIYDSQYNLEKYVDDFLDYSRGVKTKKQIYGILSDTSTSSEK